MAASWRRQLVESRIAVAAVAAATTAEAAVAAADSAWQRHELTQQVLVRERHANSKRAY